MKARSKQQNKVLSLSNAITYQPAWRNMGMPEIASFRYTMALQNHASLRRLIAKVEGGKVIWGP